MLSEPLPPDLGWFMEPILARRNKEVIKNRSISREAKPRMLHTRTIDGWQGHAPGRLFAGGKHWA